MRSENWSVIHLGAHGAGSTFNTQLEDTLNHELGHQFFASFAHVDSKTVTARNHEDTDECIMTYTSTNGIETPINDKDGIIEFAINILNAIRDAGDPR